jgi:hypothetical protein
MVFRLDRVAHITGHEQHLQVRTIHAPEPGHKFTASEFGHHHIAEQQVNLARMKPRRFQGRNSVGRPHDPVSEALQKRRQ